jgi:hypothetical protein
LARRSERGKEIVRSVASRWLLVALAGATLVGCGDSGDRRQRAKGPTHRAQRPWRTQLAAPAIASCTRAVSRAATSLPASARSELAEPCKRMDERVLENEALVHAVCQELAVATASSLTSHDTGRIESQCYGEYAKTIPAEERLPRSSSR